MVTHGHHKLIDTPRPSCPWSNVTWALASCSSWPLVHINYSRRSSKGTAIRYVLKERNTSIKGDGWDIHLKKIIMEIICTTSFHNNNSILLYWLLFFLLIFSCYPSWDNGKLVNCWSEPIKGDSDPSPLKGLEYWIRSPGLELTPPSIPENSSMR